MYFEKAEFMYCFTVKHTCRWTLEPLYPPHPFHYRLWQEHCFTCNIINPKFRFHNCLSRYHCLPDCFTLSFPLIFLVVKVSVWGNNVFLRQVWLCRLVVGGPKSSRWWVYFTNVEFYDFLSFLSVNIFLADVFFLSGVIVTNMIFGYTVIFYTWVPRIHFD